MSSVFLYLFPTAPRTRCNMYNFRLVVAASMTVTVVVTAAVAFAVMVVMIVVVASYVRVVNKFALDKVFYLLVSVAAATASESDALLKESVLCARSDTATDKEFYSL